MYPKITKPSSSEKIQTIYQTTLLQIPEDTSLQSDRGENPNSRKCYECSCVCVRCLLSHQKWKIPPTETDISIGVN
jgi:hypothetical protein